MQNSIVDAVSVALNEEFGDEYEIYGEEVEQGFKEPCFFINIISASVRRYPVNRYLRHAALCVQFFPGSIEKNRECEEAAERMERCLEYIGSDKDLQRGTEMNHEVHEGVMSFFVEYNGFVRHEEKVENGMEALESEIRVKEA